MTDRELLERAAKAAGMATAWVDDFGVFCKGMDGGQRWNPLTDDGDAFRLAVALHIPIEGMIAFVAERESDWQTAPYAATRRAIVRAAASLA